MGIISLGRNFPIPLDAKKTRQFSRHSSILICLKFRDLSVPRNFNVSTDGTRPPNSR